MVSVLGSGLSSPGHTLARVIVLCPWAYSHSASLYPGV